MTRELQNRGELAPAIKELASQFEVTLTTYMAVELDSCIYYSSYIMDEQANRLSN